MFLVRGKVGGVDENVVEVNDDADINHIGKGVVHETLECCGGVRQPEWHDEPFEGTITCMEGCLQFVSFGNAHKVIGVSEVDFGVDVSIAGSIEKVGDEWKWVTVFLCEFVKTAVVYTKTEGAILLFDEKDRSSVSGGGRADKTCPEVVIEELLEGVGFGLGKGVHTAWRGSGPLFQVDFEVVETMQRKGVSPFFTEDVMKFMIVFRNMGEVDGVF